jgi:hypothetical protein
MGGFATGFFSQLGDQAKESLDRMHTQDDEQRRSMASLYLNMLQNPNLDETQRNNINQAFMDLYKHNKGGKELAQKIGQAYAFGHKLIQAHKNAAQGGGANAAIPGTEQTGPMSEQTPIGGSSVNPPGIMPTAPPSPVEDDTGPKANGAGTAAVPASAATAAPDTPTAKPTPLPIEKAQAAAPPVPGKAQKPAKQKPTPPPAMNLGAILQQAYGAESTEATHERMEKQAEKFRKEQAGEWVNEGWLDKKSAAYRDYVMFGKPPTAAESRSSTSKMQKGGWVQGPDGIPVETYFDPADGQLKNSHTQEPIPEGTIPIAPGDWATKTINVMTPDGPRILFRKLGADGKEHVFDLQNHEEAGELIPYSPRMLNTTTDREVAGIDPTTGLMTKYILRSKRQVAVPGGTGQAPAGPAVTPAQGTPTGPPPAVTGAAKSNASPATKVPPATKAPPAANPKEHQKSVVKQQERSEDGNEGLYSGPSRLRPGSAMLPGQFEKDRSQYTSIAQVRNSLIGDHAGEGELGGIAKSLNVFNDSDQVNNIGSYLRLVEATVESGVGELTSGPHGSFGAALGTLEWAVGLPQETIKLQQQALIDAYNKVVAQDAKNGNSDGADFLNNWYRAVGTVAGMRSITSNSAYRWSVNMLRAELPRPGIVGSGGDSKKQATDKIMNLIRETNVVAPVNPMIRRMDEAKVRAAIEKGTRGGKQPAVSAPGISDKAKAYLHDQGINVQ